jgi:hypothetical protein
MISTSVLPPLSQKGEKNRYYEGYENVFKCIIPFNPLPNSTTTMRNHVHQNHVTLQQKLKKQFIYNYCAIIPSYIQNITN